MNTTYSVFTRAALVALLGCSTVAIKARAQDLGSLGVYVGQPNRGNAAAEQGFQRRTAETTLAVGQGQTMLTGFIDYKLPFGTRWVDSANWWRTSMLASAPVRQMVPVFSVGLADAVTADPIAQMQAIGNPANTSSGQVFQRIIDGFKNSGFRTLYLRIGWEHNGEWYPWGTANPDKTINMTRVAAFLAAYRRVADIAHNTPDIDVITVWSPNFERLTPEEVALTYPGDEYVDVIAPDMYSPVWNSIPQNWDPAITWQLSDAEWKANTINRQHSWDYPMGSVDNPTAGYGLVAMMQFALERNKPFGLGETGTDGGMSGTWYRGPEDRGDFPLYLTKRLTEKMAQGLRFAYLGLWDSGAYRFSNGARHADTSGWVTLINTLAGADPIQAEEILGVVASDPVSEPNDLGATGNYVPDPSRQYVRDSDIGGRVSKLVPDAVGDFVEYAVPVPVAGTYRIKARFKRDVSRGAYRLLVAGTQQGEVQDLYRAGPEYVVLDFGKRSFAGGGTVPFRFEVTGRHPDATGYSLVLDYIDLTPDRMEIETLTTGESSASKLLFREVAASSGAAERLNATGPGDFFEYIVPVIEPGTYRVKVRVKKHNARGMFQLTIGGAYQGLVQDQYTPYGDPNPYVELDLGTKLFGASGDKVFRFTVTDKNPASLGYWLAFDYIALERE